MITTLHGHSHVDSTPQDDCLGLSLYASLLKKFLPDLNQSTKQVGTYAQYLRIVQYIIYQQTFLSLYKNLKIEKMLAVKFDNLPK